MDNLFLLLFLGCFFALIIGIIKPRFVIKWGDEAKKTRKSVLKVYGLGLIVSFILFGIFVEDEGTVNVNQMESSDTQISNNENIEEVAVIEESSTKEVEEKEVKLAAEKSAELKVQQVAAKDPMKQEWNTKDTDAMNNDNLYIAAKVLQYYREDEFRSLSEVINEADVLKAVWKYYGKVMQISGEAGYIVAYAPGSDISQVLANGEECYELHMVSDTGVAVGIIVIGDSSNVSEGDYVTVYGLPVGIFENENAFGGIVNELFLIGK